MRMQQAAYITINFSFYDVNDIGGEVNVPCSLKGDIDVQALIGVAE